MPPSRLLEFSVGIFGRLRTESVGWLGLPARSHEPVVRPARCGVRERSRARSALCHWEGPVRDRSLTWARRRVVPPPTLSSQGRVDVVDDCGRIQWISKASRHESLAPACMRSHVRARSQPLSVRGPNRGTDRFGWYRRRDSLQRREDVAAWVPPRDARHRESGSRRSPRRRAQPPHHRRPRATPVWGRRWSRASPTRRRRYSRHPTAVPPRPDRGEQRPRRPRRDLGTSVGGGDDPGDHERHNELPGARIPRCHRRPSPSPANSVGLPCARSRCSATPQTSRRSG